ncbi:TATA element modulatory factor isoform X2 [Labeo rohita]|nr:TATA element modulatory factor isoform X2 [Labeo rohita]XP_050978365.1 TATA element modulatory factor isoform X2 [Labeo rohita]
MRTSAMQLAAAREENQSVTRKLKAQEKELQMRREHLNKRAENVKKDQEKLRQFKLENEETLKKNEARRLCAIERIKENKAKIKVTEEDIKKLKERYEALLARKELLELQVKQHQESTAKMPGKIEDTGRDSDCGGMQSIREEILEKWDNEEKEAESKKLEVLKDINELRILLLHYTNKLQQQQRELENLCSETREWEIKRDELRSATEREALQCAQIKARIHSIYELIAPYWRVSVNIKDPYRQLELIKKHFLLMRAVDDEQMCNVLSTENQTEAESIGQRRFISKL